MKAFFNSCNSCEAQNGYGPIQKQAESVQNCSIMGAFRVFIGVLIDTLSAPSLAYSPTLATHQPHMPPFLPPSGGRTSSNHNLVSFPTHFQHCLGALFERAAVVKCICLECKLFSQLIRVIMFRIRVIRERIFFIRLPSCR